MSILKITKGKNNVQILLEVFEKGFKPDISKSFKVFEKFSSNDNLVLILSDNDCEDFEFLKSKIDKIDKIFFIGKINDKFLSLFSEKIECLKNKEHLVEKLKIHPFDKQSIVIRIPQNMYPEEIENALKNKVHDTMMLVNLSNIATNLNFFKSKLNSSTKLMCMVKARSYGHSHSQAGKFLESEKSVDYLGVAYVDEGVKLREDGVKLPIIVMNPERSSYDTLIKYDLEPEIYSFRVLERFMMALNKNKNKKPYPIHIKIDSGMHRVGFLKQDIDVLIKYLKTVPELKVSSVFSHLAAAEDLSEKDFTLKQISYFKNIAQKMEDQLGYKVIKHILNSSGIINYHQYQFDMVRLGLGLYGFSADKNTEKNLKIAARLESVISQIHNLESGETIGYNRRYKCLKDSKIAVLPIGYADGISRLWGQNGGYVNIKGQKAPIVGSICMDTLMVDITGIDCIEGDKVVVFGHNPSAEDIAKATSTISYEVMTSISDRVKREYLFEF